MWSSQSENSNSRYKYIPAKPFYWAQSDEFLLLSRPSSQGDEMKISFSVSQLVMCGLGLGPKPRLGLGLEGPTAWVMVRPSPSRQGGLGLGSAQGWAAAFWGVPATFV